jgi:pyruvate dehydrogenase E2 component (dihydrolipoamide acetyltransferase)
MSIEFKLPDLGENVEAGDVVNVLVAEGDEIRSEQNVLELETDKAVVELPCPHAGKVSKVHVKPGDKLKVGDRILTIEETAKPAAEAKEAKAPPAAKAKKPAEKPAEKPAAKERPKREEAKPAAEEIVKAETEEREPSGEVEEELERPSRVRARAPEGANGGAPQPAPAGPATRRLARELGVDLHQVRGTGPSGRITQDDVKGFVRQVVAGGAVEIGAPPLPDFAQWGEVERQPLSGIRRKTAEAMSLAWRLVPHVTQFDTADITELEAARRRRLERRKEEPKVTITVLAMKACAALLESYPRFNSSLDLEAGELVMKSYCHIGVAVDTPHGLLVPVVRDADRKGVLELAAEVADLASRARERKLELSEMRGASFTITNLGGIGGTAFTPIVNYPEVAILGLSRAREELVPRQGRTEVRLILPLSLSYDHRVIDGADGARFLRTLADMLSDPYSLLIEI